MIEKIVKDYLHAALAMPVYTETPEVPEEEYITIERTGGGESNYIRSATLAIQTHAQSLYRAAELNEEVIAAMDGITTLNSVSSAKLNSDYNYTNTKTKVYRYQAVYDLVYF